MSSQFSELHAGRPLATEDASVADKGAFELEIGYDYAHTDTNNKTFTLTTVPIYGLTERLELDIEIPFTLDRPKGGRSQEGLQDINLILKALLAQEQDIWPALALKAQVKTASGNEDKGLGSGDADYTLVLAASKTINRLTFHLNSGYTFVGNSSDPTLNDTILYGLATEYALSDRLTIVGEIYGESGSHFHISSTGNHDFTYLAGFTYALNDQAIFDLGISINSQDKEITQYATTMGITICL